MTLLHATMWHCVLMFLRFGPVVQQSYLRCLHMEADTPTTCRRMQSHSCFKKWLSVHLCGAAKSHTVGMHGNDVYWFCPPQPGVELSALIDVLSQHRAQSMAVATTKEKIAALAVHQNQ